MQLRDQNIVEVARVFSKNDPIAVFFAHRINDCTAVWLSRMEKKNLAKSALAICDQLIDLSIQERKRKVADLRVKDAALASQVEELLQAVENSGTFLQLDEEEL